MLCLRGPVDVSDTLCHFVLPMAVISGCNVDTAAIVGVLTDMETKFHELKSKEFHTAAISLVSVSKYLF